MDARGVHLEIRRDLRAHESKKGVQVAKRFFREPIRTYGLSAPKIRPIAKKYVKKVRSEATLPEVLSLSEKLLRGGILDEASLVNSLVWPFRKELDESHFRTFDRWVNHFSNWATTDSVCTGSIAILLERYPKLIRRLKPWTHAKSRWRRRAAAVSLVTLARRGLIKPRLVFDVVEPLMKDYDDMVQKGTGWVLRDLSLHYQSEVVGYLRRHPDAGRILVRYVCEKLPANKRRLFIKPK